MTFGEWLQAGIDAGWCGSPYCEMHDIDRRVADFIDSKDYDDPCVVVVALYPFIPAPETT